MVKSHNRLKETKVFACGFSGKNLFLGSCHCKLAALMSYKRLHGQLYQKRDAYTETHTQSLSVN